MTDNERFQHFDEPRAVPPSIAIEGYTVGSWCPTKDGSGPPEAVAIMLEVAGVPILLRLKSRQAVNDMIESLERYREDVWPDV